MQRFIPEAGAWLDKWRGRVSRYVLVMVPAVLVVGGFLFSRADLIRANERGETEVAAQQAADARSGATTVASAWRAKALERNASTVIERLARQHGISTGLARQIYTAAVDHDIEPEVAFGLVRTESSFRRTVVSYAGAVGYTQLLPSTARWIAPGTTRGQLFNTTTNLQVGFKYLRYLMDKYEQDTRLALLAYNRGPGTVDRLLSRGADPANGYARRVLSG